jgi:molybdopterin-binding protein
MIMDCRRCAARVSPRRECVSGGYRLLMFYHSFRAERPVPLLPAPHLRNAIGKSYGQIMKLSARNQIMGKIVEVKKGATTAHVRLEIAPGQIITASITNEAVDDLGLKAGAEAIAVIKASDVMIAID